jgi:hypothetical protein
MKLMFKRSGQYVVAHWRMVIAVCLGIFLICFLMLFRLGSISGGLSPAELQQQLFASSWRHILHNPLNAPLTVVEWLILTLVPHHGATVTRAASPIFGVLAMIAFAYVLRRWYGVRSAVYGTVIFGLSSWLLHVSRYVSSDILYLWAVPTLLAISIAWERHRNGFVHYLLIFTVASLLYIPGLVWLVLAVFLLQPHLLAISWRKLATVVGRTSGALFFILLLVPLGWALVTHPSLIQTWLGLPTHFGTPGNFVRGILHSLSFFMYKGPTTATVWLPRLPILDFFCLVMMILGVLFYAKHIRAPRTRMLITLFILGAALFALGGPVTISVLVPLMYLLVAAGLGYLLHEWLLVFPRNPIARGLGFSLLGIAVTLTCIYNLRSYFVAWPHNTATKAAFHKTSDN